MNKFVLISLMSILFFGCNNASKQNENQAAEKSAVVYSVDDLYANAAELEGKEVVVKGTVMHVCKQGGGRCFLMGSTEDMNIRVEAGEKIGAFSQEQMGSDLTITGVFKEVRTEADAHNPAGEHGEEEAHEEDAETEEAHRIIAEAQEATDVVYFIEGLKIQKEEI
ncbi:MAG TPA: hypothetical protein VJ919_18535 [Tangfeifania sp.]|nr:hypothetical protein [Tangfeifania sp.]